jgi:hypothetical protein
MVPGLQPGWKTGWGVALTTYPIAMRFKKE